MSKVSTVAKGAAILAIGTLTSRLLGLVRENLISHYYGTSLYNGAFRAAYSVPDLLYYLLAGGALSAAFIPVFWIIYCAASRRKQIASAARSAI